MVLETAANCSGKRAIPLKRPKGSLFHRLDQRSDLSAGPELWISYYGRYRWTGKYIRMNVPSPSCVGLRCLRLSQSSLEAAHVLNTSLNALHV